MIPSKKTRREIIGIAFAAATASALAACAPAAAPTPTTAPVATTAPASAPTTAPASAPTTAPSATTAPASTAGKPTLTLSHWWGDQFKTWIPMVKERTGISIQEQVIGWTDYYTKIMTQLVGGTATDIVMTDTAWYGQFFSSGDFLPFDALIKDAATKGTMDPKKFYYPQEKACGYAGKQYGLEIFLAQDLVVFANKAQAEAAGVLKDLPVWGSPTFDTWHWDKWLDAMKAGTKRKSDGTVDQYGLSGVAWGDVGKTLLYMSGGTYFDNDWGYDADHINMDQPAWADTLQFLADLVLTHKVAPGPDIVIQGGTFQAGKSMMVCTGATPSSVPPKLFPQVYMHQPWSKQKTAIVGANALCINKTTKYANDAFEWIRVYLTDPALRESQRVLSAVPAYDPVPIVQAAPEGPEKIINLVNLSRRAGFSTVPDDTKDILTFWRGAGIKGQFVNDQIDNALQAVLTGKTKVADALKEAKTAIDTELKKK